MADLEHMPAASQETSEPAEQAEPDLETPEGKAELVEQLTERLDAVVEANEQLEGQVEATALETAVDVALQDPEAVGIDTIQALEAIPTVDASGNDAMVAEAKALQAELATADQSVVDAKVKLFAQDKVGGTLASVLEGLGKTDLSKVDLSTLAKVFGEEMPSGADLGKLASQMLNPPLGELIYKAATGSVEADVKKQIRDGKLSPDMIKVLAMVMPDAAVYAAPAVEVLGKITRNLEAVPKDGEGKVSLWDQAKAVLDGLVPTGPEAKKLLVSAIAKGMSDPDILAAVGLDGVTGTVISKVGEFAAKNPDATIKVLEKTFGDGGIVAEPSEIPAEAISMAA